MLKETLKIRQVKQSSCIIFEKKQRSLQLISATQSSSQSERINSAAAFWVELNFGECASDPAVITIPRRHKHPSAKVS